MEAIISGAFCLLIGTVGVWAGVKQLGNRVALNKWPTTKGKVIERGTYQPFIPAAGPPGFRYAPLVKYVYQVAGKEFTNDRIRPKRIQLPQHNTKEWAQKKANSFADEVTVHYNPEDPSESFLVQTSRAMLFIVCVASSLAILLGLLFLLVFSPK
jgi:Protein of unknown function (DUF3592)